MGLEERWARIEKQMEDSGIDQLLISDPTAIYYLTKNWIQPEERLYLLLIDRKGDHCFFLHPLFRLEEETDLKKEWLSDTQDPIAAVAKALRKDAVIGVDKNWPARFLLPLMERCPGNRYRNGSYLVDAVRMQKDAQEQRLMKEASRVNDWAMEQIISLIEDDPSAWTEKKLAVQLGKLYREQGAFAFSFDPIFAFGKNGANPHHECDDTVLQGNGLLVIDIGCIKDRYCSDMTRTVSLGCPSDAEREIYDIVLEAHLRGIQAAQPGARFCDVDQAAREYISAKGYGEYFTHRTGHSIGLEGHEFGDVSETNQDIIRPGMIFSVEPGIYLPGKFGVRIEDLVLITEDGHEIINHHPKDMRIL